MTKISKISLLCCHYNGNGMLQMGGRVMVGDMAKQHAGDFLAICQVNLYIYISFFLHLFRIILASLTNSLY